MNPHSSKTNILIHKVNSLDKDLTFMALVLASFAVALIAMNVAVIG